MDRYLVIGNPISHSLSPQIHTEFAKQTHQQLTYDRLCVEPKDFFQTLDQFFAAGGKGANITAPFKSMAFDYVQTRCTERAKLAKAVNTLYLNSVDNLVYGDNTDGIGFLRDLQQHHWSLTNKNLLILGTGGAARGILPSLISQHPSSITIYNRTSTKINALIHEFQPPTTQLISFSNQIKTYDLIINSIPSAHISQAECWSWLSSCLNSDTHAYDLNYSQLEDPPFITQIKTLGCKHTLNGLGLLLEQAAESFFIWRGVRPSIPKGFQDAVLFRE